LIFRLLRIYQIMKRLHLCLIWIVEGQHRKKKSECWEIYGSLYLCTVWSSRSHELERMTNFCQWYFLVSSDFNIPTTERHQASVDNGGASNAHIAVIPYQQPTGD
jgi:hypothetical protein